MTDDLKALTDRALAYMPAESQFSATPLAESGNVLLIMRLADDATASVLMSQNDVHALISLLARCTLADPDLEDQTP